MLVSTISANHNINKTFISLNNINNNVDNATFNSSNFLLKDNPEQDLKEVYNSINEWKDYCLKDASTENLNIIA